MANIKSDKPTKTKILIEELEVLAVLKESSEWDMAKRIANKYIDTLVKQAFNIPANDSNAFSKEFVRYKGQVEGIKDFIKLIDDSGKRLSKMGKKK